MKPRPIRMLDALWSELQEEAERQGLGTAEYVRQILGQRHGMQSNTEADTQENTEVAEALDRLDEIEEHIAAFLLLLLVTAALAGKYADRSLGRT